MTTPQIWALTSFSVTKDNPDLVVCGTAIFSSAEGSTQEASDSKTPVPAVASQAAVMLEVGLLYTQTKKTKTMATKKPQRAPHKKIK